MVLVSVHHYYNRNMKNVILPENNIVTAWVEVRYFSTDVLKIILWFKGEVSHRKEFHSFPGSWPKIDEDLCQRLEWNRTET